MNTNAPATGGSMRKQSHAKRAALDIWATTGSGSEKQRDEDAIRVAVANLSAGKIVALRGLGGYQLLVDATNQSAVERLRERKGRRAKPLAVMVESLDAARRLAHIDQNEAAAFEDPSAPIVLLRSHSKNGLAPAIHPHLDTVGLMRPTTPLHAILARDFGRPLVCTSANREGDPLEYREENGRKALGRHRRFMATSQSGDYSAD